jgi:hypothetical protein
MNDGIPKLMSVIYPTDDPHNDRAYGYISYYDDEDDPHLWVYEKGKFADAEMNETEDCDRYMATVGESRGFKVYGVSLNSRGDMWYTDAFLEEDIYSYNCDRLGIQQDDDTRYEQAFESGELVDYTDPSFIAHYNAKNGDTFRFIPLSKMKQIVPGALEDQDISNGVCFVHNLSRVLAVGVDESGNMLDDLTDFELNLSVGEDECLVITDASTTSYIPEKLQGVTERGWWKGEPFTEIHIRGKVVLIEDLFDQHAIARAPEVECRSKRVVDIKNGVVSYWPDSYYAVDENDNIMSKCETCNLDSTLQPGRFIIDGVVRRVVNEYSYLNGDDRLVMDNPILDEEWYNYVE